MATRRIAIACQGGGSHTAFTAGVLDGLLAATDSEFEIVELAGTSGGAVCAFAAWVGLVRGGPADGRAEARRLLAQVWDDIAADTPVEAAANAAGVGTARARGMGLPVPGVSPYDAPVAAWSRDILRRTLERVVDPAELASLVEREGPLPRLDIGAVDVQRGTFRTFTEREMTHDAVLASAAVPPLFRAAPVSQGDGTTRWYWDGLFSQNPPLGDLLADSPDRVARAEELWLVQINPQREDERPTTLEAIADRRNELGGNLAVNQELRFLRQANQWYADGHLTDVYRPITVRTINFEESRAFPGRTLDYATKLDRSPSFLARLREHGREQADRFLAAARARRRVRHTVEGVWSGGADLTGGLPPSFRLHLPTSLPELRRYRRGDVEAPESTVGPAGYAAFVRALHRGFPDLTLTVEESVTEGDRVAVRWRGTGTHDGPLAGVAPTGRQVTLSGMSLYHLEDGRPVAAWVLTEQWGLLQQLAGDRPTAPLPTVSRVSATPVVTQLSAPAEHVALARRLVEAVWNDGQRRALSGLVDDACCLHLDDGSDPRGPDAYWAVVERYRRAFPDLSVTIEETVAEADKVVLRTRVRGTHDGPFLGIEPTGNAVAVARLTVHHLADDRIVETGFVEDTVRLCHQLGATPDAVSAGPLADAEPQPP